MKESQEDLINDYARRSSLKFQCQDRRIEEAFRNVKRHLFAPENTDFHKIYSDELLPILSDGDSGEFVSTLSQPSLVAMMLDQLCINPGDRILEIGTSSGYSAALAAHLNERPDLIFTIEYQKELEKFARANFDRAGCSEINSKITDGFYGWADEGPFDIITASVGLPAIPKTLISQLKEGGTFAVPLTISEAGGFSPYYVGRKIDGKLRGRFHDTPFFFMTLLGGHKLEILGSQIDYQIVEEQLAKTSPAKGECFTSFESLSSFLLYLTLNRKRVTSIEVNTEDLKKSYFGCIRDVDNFWLVANGSMYLRGENEFRDELKNLKREWERLGYSQLSDFNLTLDLSQPNNFEGWRIWDFEATPERLS